MTSLPRRLSHVHEVYAVGVLATALFCTQAVAFHSLRHDDAFITYRYGRNLALGNGLVFNPGEYIMGSTAPGHALLAAAVHILVGRDLLPSVMSTLGCLGWTLQAVAVALMTRPALGRLSYLLGLFIGLGAAWSCRHVAIETNIVAAFAMGALAAAVYQRWAAAALLAGCAALVRPDACLLALPLAVLCWRDLGRDAWKPCLLFLAVTCPWLLFAELYFGTVIPNTFGAKVLESTWQSQVIYVANLAPTVLWSRYFALPSDQDLAVLRCVVTYGAAAVGAALLVHHCRRLWILPVTMLLYLGAYMVLRARSGAGWHLYPVVLLCAVFILTIPLDAMARVRRVSIARALAVAVSALLLLCAYRTWEFAEASGSAFWFGARNESYLAVASYLNTHARPDDILLAWEPGTIGYYTDLRVIDLGGLVTRDPRSTSDAVGPLRHWVAAWGHPHPCTDCTFVALSQKAATQSYPESAPFQADLQLVNADGPASPRPPTQPVDP